MKYKGADVTGLAQGTVTLMKPSGPIKLTVTAIPLGTEGKPRLLFPSPEAPMEIVMKKGRAVTGTDGRIIKEYNYQDADYLTKASRAANLQMAYLVYGSLQEDEDLEFDTTLDSCNGDERLFYSRIYDEFQTAGFTLGDIRIIQKEILRVSNIDAEAIEERIDDFLLEHPDREGELASLALS